MTSFSSFLSSKGGVHQVLQTGDVLTDLTIGRSGFVVSDTGGTALVTDGHGRLHQLLRNGNMTTDLITGRTYFEI